jgi:hypothetical protein
MAKTMAHICRLRLMAEEVRTDADGFACVEAKRTMLDVATTYDRIADDLERLLSNESRRREASI